jgi:hypothetical protein
LYEKIGVEFGYRPLAAHMDMDHTTLARLLKGGRTSKPTIKKVADKFGVTPAKIHELRGESAALAYEPFILPDEAGRLSENERRVIRAMIRALLDARGPDDPTGRSRNQTQVGPLGGAVQEQFVTATEPKPNNRNNRQKKVD